MPKYIEGGGNPEQPKAEERYGGSRYRSRRVIEEEHPKVSPKLAARKAALEAGHRNKSRENFGDLVGYHGDRIGLINITNLCPWLKRGKRAR